MIAPEAFIRAHGMLTGGPADPDQLIGQGTGREAKDLISLIAGRSATSPRFVLQPLSALQPVLTGSWSIKGLLASAGLAVIFGASLAGKSFLALDVGLHIAAGLDWAGRKVRQAGVVYIAGEGQQGVVNRLLAAVAARNIPADAPFALIATAPNLGTADGDAAQLIECIRSQSAALGYKPGVVFIDTLARSMPGSNENDSADMNRFIANADLVGRELECLVVVVHHTGHGEQSRMRGSSTLPAAADTVWEVSQTEAGRRVRIAKQKDGPGDLEWRFGIVPVALGTDEDGDPVETCTVEIQSQPEHSAEHSTRKAKQPKGQAAEFVKAVRLAVDEMGEAMPASEHIPAKIKGIRRDGLKAYANKLGFMDGKDEDSRKSIRNRHIRTLAGNGFLCQWGEWIWLP